MKKYLRLKKKDSSYLKIFHHEKRREKKTKHTNWIELRNYDLVWTT